MGLLKCFSSFYFIHTYDAHLQMFPYELVCVQRACVSVCISLRGYMCISLSVHGVYICVHMCAHLAVCMCGGGACSVVELSLRREEAVGRSAAWRLGGEGCAARSAFQLPAVWSVCSRQAGLDQSPQIRLLAPHTCAMCKHCCGWVLLFLLLSICSRTSFQSTNKTNTYTRIQCCFYQ